MHRSFISFFSLVSRSILAIVVMLYAVGACQPSSDENADIELNWEITPHPPQVGPATISLTLRDSTDQLIQGADIELEGNMSHPGMQPVLTEAQEVKPGQYEAEMEFTMSGDWFILVNATLPDERVVEKQIDISGVRSE